MQKKSGYCYVSYLLFVIVRLLLLKNKIKSKLANQQLYFKSKTHSTLPYCHIIYMITLHINCGFIQFVFNSCVVCVSITLKRDC